jgi:hypothetical protein
MPSSLAAVVAQHLSPRREIRPRAVGLLLAFILCLQLGLVLWVLLEQRST